MLAEKMAIAINNSLDSGPVASRSRKFILLKESKKPGFKPFNGLQKLEPSYAIYFRYFWLELLLLDENHAMLREVGVDIDKAKGMLDGARVVYVNFLYEERLKLRKKDSDIQDKSAKDRLKEASKRAKKEIIEELAQSYHYWFGRSIQECRDLLKSIVKNIDTLQRKESEEENGDTSVEQEDEVMSNEVEDDKI